MYLTSTEFHTLIIACWPALAALLIGVLIGAASVSAAYKKAVTNSIRQSRLEIDLLRRSTDADRVQMEETVQRTRADLIALRNDSAERLRTLQGQIEPLAQGSRTGQGGAAFDYRPGAFETLWNKVLKIREFAGPILAIYNLPSSSEFLPVDERLRHLLPRTFEEDFQSRAEELSEGAENLRPFLGEDIWQIFSVYYAYAIRSSAKVIAGRSQGHIPPWDKDFEGNDDIRNLLLLVLSDSELAIAVGDQPGGAPLRILTALECMMVDTMNVWMFGSPLSQLALKDREKVAHTIPPETELIQPAPRPASVSMLGTLRLSPPRYRKSINPRLRAK